MASYQTDREISDRFIAQIKHFVGPLLLEPASLELDAKEATDLIVLRARDMRIAARIRRNGFYDNFGSQFTIRASRDSGAETELSKIINGWGHWFFYGHLNEAETAIVHWMVVDLSSFRAGLIRNSRGAGAIRCGDKANGDGTYFKWFDVRSFPHRPPLFVSCSSDHAAAREEAA